MLLHRGGETVDICLLGEQMRANVDGFVLIVKDIVGGASGIEIAGRWSSLDRACHRPLSRQIARQTAPVLRTLRLFPRRPLWTRLDTGFVGSE